MGFRLSAVETMQAGQTDCVYCNDPGDYRNPSSCLGHFSANPPQAGGYAELFDCHVTACDTTFYYDLGPVSALEPGSQPQVLIATLAIPLGGNFAGEDAAYDGARILACGQLYLHYAEAAPNVQDLQGNVLDPLALSWVDDPAGQTASVGGILPEGPMARWI